MTFTVKYSTPPRVLNFWPPQAVGLSRSVEWTQKNIVEIIEIFYSIFMFDNLFNKSIIIFY